MRRILAFLVCFSLLLAPLSGASPYTLATGLEIGTLGSGLCLAGSGLWIDGKTKRGLTPSGLAGLDSGSINSFDRPVAGNWSPGAAGVSDILLGFHVCLPLLFLAGRETREDWSTFGLMYGETLLLTQGLTVLAKAMVDRARPFAYGPDAPEETKLATDANRSFFSGHSSTVFASAVFCAVTFSDYYPESALRPFVWAGALLTASLTAALRMAAGKHFPSDVLTGAAVGSLAGWLIPTLHRANRADNGHAAPGMAISIPF